MKLIDKKNLLLILAAVLIIAADIAFIYSRGLRGCGLSGSCGSMSRQGADTCASRGNKHRNKTVTKKVRYEKNDISA